MMANAKAAATAAAAANDTLAEINECRTKPKEYAQHVEALLTLFDGQVMKRPGQIDLMTNEGTAAVQECVDFLRAATPLPPLERVSPGMSAAAADHCADLGKSGGTGHDGSDGSSPFDRLSRHGTWSGTAAENIAFGNGSARDRVVQLLVDDGVSNRGHRSNIFGKDFKVLGVANGSHPQFSSMQVQTFAAGYTEGAGAKPPAATAPATSAPKPAAVSKPGPPLKPPAGGRVDIKKSMVTTGNKKVTTTTTITTYADGSTETKVETLEETLP